MLAWPRLVHLPTEEMKGRIIGREGRNIKAFEAATGVTLLIDESPQMVLISSFDPVRREVARSALDALIKDTGPAIEVAKRHWTGPLAAYPESGHFVMPSWQFVDVMAPEDFVTHAMGWLRQGVQVLGGCCGLGPDHIRLLRERLPAQVPRSG